MNEYQNAYARRLADEVLLSQARERLADLDDGEVW